ncbi:MAG TPA: hypothetical protein VF961_04215, partial [Pyrinomonadaceae bacterium]
MFRNSRAFIVVSLLLTFSILEPLAPIGVAQQQQQRERRVAPTALPTPSPTPSEIPAGTPNSQLPAQQGRQQRTTAFTTRTTVELQARISEILRRPELAPAIVGIK